MSHVLSQLSHHFHVLVVSGSFAFNDFAQFCCSLHYLALIFSLMNQHTNEKYVHDF